jgi:hypothetical protein
MHLPCGSHTFDFSGIRGYDLPITTTTTEGTKMIENRNWTHDENPEAKPSAATYREGCRCDGCKEANSAYMRAYRAKRVREAEAKDGTSIYHTHAGQPSKRTSRKWLCIHPRCLKLAGLALNAEGAVVSASTGVIDPTFGALTSPSAA